MALDLNDLYYFQEVVTHGGFAPAGRALRQPKSKLSRRVAQLEDRLGVRLIERSTRRFRVTEIGQSFYERCRAMMLEAEQAEAVVAEKKAEPDGTVRFACPLGAIEAVAQTLAQFVARYSKVRLQVVAANRPIDLISERIDVALRARDVPEVEASLTMRTMTLTRRVLVASPAFINVNGFLDDIAALGTLPTLSAGERPDEDVWELIGPGDVQHTLRHQPRYSCGDFSALRIAAESGLGVAMIPAYHARAPLAAGSLVRVLPKWSGRRETIYLVFTTRRGLPPAVRALIDMLVENFREIGEE